MHIGNVNSVGAEGKMTMHLIIGNIWSIIQILTIHKLYVVILLSFFTGTVENILCFIYLYAEAEISMLMVSEISYVYSFIIACLISWLQ